jgi:ATP-dependent DNA helicase RecQ
MHATLETVFGHTAFRPGQEAAISAVLDGRSAAAIFPTGSGKSLCYQVPALMLPHLTLVVSPLLALMQDQLAFLHSRGVAAASIDSSQSREQTAEVMTQARAGALKILMISVERLGNIELALIVGKLQVIGTEIMAPLRDTVGFVDHQQ